MNRELSANTTLSHYRIVSKIGEGGMGEAYRARAAKLGRDVAIKVLPAGFSEDIERLRRLEQEAQAAGSRSAVGDCALAILVCDHNAKCWDGRGLQGRRLEQPRDAIQTHIDVVLNWFTVLKQAVAGNR